MKLLKKLLPCLLVIFFGLTFFSSCEIDEETATNDLMEGVWRLSEAYDVNDSLITDDVTNWFPTFLHLDDMNSVNSTAGPLFMYLVYGDSKFIEITSKFDAVFNYAEILVDGDITLTEGEWFIDKNDVVDNFTIEIKLRFPTANSLNDILSILNLNLPEFLEDMVDIIVYHKFKFVTVDISDDNPDRMIWEFTDDCVPTYNSKDSYGDLVTYTGIPTDSYTRMKVVFDKQVKGLRELTEEAAAEK